MKDILCVALGALTLTTGHALKVAYIGDSSVSPDSLNNINLMKNHSVDILVHNGDFDYKSNPDLWTEFLQKNWGKDVLATSGNHETDWISTLTSGGAKWNTKNGYKTQLFEYASSDRQSYSLDKHCKPASGKTMAESYGETYSCEIEDVLHVFVGFNELSGALFYPNLDQSAVHEYLESVLSNSTAKWRVCNWHRPEGKLQPSGDHTGNYKSQTAYEICRKYGAFVISGHTHLYSRTKLISGFQPVTVSDRDASPQLDLDCGHIFVAVNGMGGKSREVKGKFGDNEYFAISYLEDSGPALNGVLICDYQSNTTTCEYVVTGNEVFDEFTLTPPRPAAECVDAVVLETLDPFKDPDYEGHLEPEVEMTLILSAISAFLLLMLFAILKLSFLARSRFTRSSREKLRDDHASL